MKFNKKQLLIIIIASITITSFTFGNLKKQNKPIKFNQELTNQQNKTVDISKKFKPVFNQQGIEEIALISMVKDEADIIFENLVWHFCLGFRKFIIIDNLSTDKTAELIQKFARLAKDNAKVLLISDPIVEHIQSRIMTGAYQLASSIWPEVEWIFPVDADEFWLVEQDLSTILKQIPLKYQALSVMRADHLPTKDYCNYQNQPFYISIPNRMNNLNNSWAYKSAVRAGNNNLVISQGNHTVFPSESSSKGWLIEGKDPKYEIASGNLFGIHMTEYHMRSIAQTHSKLSNGMKANFAAKKKDYITQGAGSHWDQYQAELEQYGNEAAKIRFESLFQSPDNLVNDPLPVDRAIKLFEEIINK